MKWMGVSCSVKNNQGEMSKLCSCKYPNGCCVEDFDGAIRFVMRGNLYGPLANPFIKTIDHHLMNGGSFIIRFRWDDGGHYSFCDGGNGKTYKFVNHYRYKTLSNVSRRRLIKMLRSYACFVWFINKAIS